MMLKVAAIVKLPSYGVSYDGAHNFMESFLDSQRGKIAEGDSIAISFRETLSLNESFIFGLAEFIRAQKALSWSVQHTNLPEHPQELMELVPGLAMLDKGCIPYVERVVKPL